MNKLIPSLIIMFALISVSTVTTSYGYTPPFISSDNKHFYHYIHDPGVTWTEAKAAAEVRTHLGIQGHLATISYSFENLFIQDLLPDDARAWIGLSDETTEGTYTWVTGEPLIYTNWDPVQPDNYNNNEDFVEILENTHKWNDLPNNNTGITGYVVEYSPGPILNPDNGNYYKYVADYGITWFTAKQLAENTEFDGIKGHLVTIQSEEENDFIDTIVPYYADFWIGYSDIDDEGNFSWINGELNNYTNWAQGEPNNTTDKNFVQYDAVYKTWSVTTNTNDSVNGYMVEYAMPARNPENGHYYEIVYDNSNSWTEALTAADNHFYKGSYGHLVTITTEDENEFIKSLTKDTDKLWIGASDAIVEGHFQWITGDPFNYTNWNIGQPDNNHNDEDYIILNGSTGKWDDNLIYTSDINGYIVEYADIDDYIVEYSVEYSD